MSTLPGYLHYQHGTLDSIKTEQIFKINSVDRVSCHSHSWMDWWWNSMMKQVSFIKSDTNTHIWLFKKSSWTVSLWWRTSVGLKVTRGKWWSDVTPQEMTSSCPVTFPFFSISRQSKHCFLCLNVNSCCDLFSGWTETKLGTWAAIKVWAKCF